MMRSKFKSLCLFGIFVVSICAFYNQSSSSLYQLNPEPKQNLKIVKDPNIRAEVLNHVEENAAAAAEAGALNKSDTNENKPQVGNKFEPEVKRIESQKAKTDDTHNESGGDTADTLSHFSEEAVPDEPIKAAPEKPIKAESEPSKWDLKTYSELLLGDDRASDIPDKNKREALKGMMKWAWNGYKDYAWGWTGLDPVGKRLNHAGPFGDAKCGATIIDSLDTLHIMGMMGEFSDGVNWLVDNFERNFMAITNKVSVFEVTIRYIGGFLGGYTLSKDKRLLNLAKVVADGLLPAFDTPTGLPMTLVSPHTKRKENYNWAAGRCGILADMGTIDLEFKYLSHCLGDDKYKKVALNVRDKISQTHLIKKDSDGNEANGLFPLFISQDTGKSCNTRSSIAAMGDSFYEYLLKSYVMDKTDEQGKKMYEDTLQAIDKFFVKHTENDYWYLEEVPPRTHKMEHLACFVPGLLALGTKHMPPHVVGRNTAYWTRMAEKLADSCHLMYTQAATGIGPNEAYFDSHQDGYALDRYSLLRPEAVESWFYLYRVTKDEKYKQWAWDYAKAIEKYAKAEGGYSGLRNVNAGTDGPGNRNNLDGNQQSFLLAETFKYMYLIFSDESVIDIDKYVFNTEAHTFERF